MAQTSIFDYLYDEYKLTKPIRLIELFAGYGSQHLALNYLCCNVESHKIIEWAVPSIQAYKDLHCENKNDDYTVDMTSDEVLNKLLNYGISANYNEPMTIEQIKRKGYEWQKQVYNNIKNTNNLVNIMNVKGEDLEISELDKYDYLMTYSFPCQDLSLAGKRLGMDADSKTRSSMLWQVHRILDELKQLNQLPNVLLMENVPQVMAKDNLQNMEKWDDFLSKLGYKSYIKSLIATDYGIPQIRNRTFMISILGDYVYTFPKPTPLELKLSDLLEEQVDEKYFLSDKMIECFMTIPKSGYPRDERLMTSLNSVNQNDVANTINTKAGTRPSDNFIVSKGIATNESKEWQKEPLEEISRTLLSNKANCGVGVLLENKKTKIKNLNYSDGTFSTLGTNCGSSTSAGGGVVIIKDNLKNKLSNDLITSDNFIIDGKRTKKYRNYVSWEDKKGRINTQDHRVYDGDVIGTISAMERGIPNILIPEATKKGYTEAREGDGIYINRPYQKRGVVQKGKIQTIKTSCDDVGVVVNQQNYEKLRIRKITPLEAFRLMGVKDEDYYKIAANQSNSSLYHLAGDAICTTVLMGIFGKMLDIDWKEWLFNGISL